MAFPYDDHNASAMEQGIAHFDEILSEICIALFNGNMAIH